VRGILAKETEEKGPRATHDKELVQFGHVFFKALAAQGSDCFCFCGNRRLGLWLPWYRCLLSRALSDDRQVLVSIEDLFETVVQAGSAANGRPASGGCTFVGLP